MGTNIERNCITKKEEQTYKYKTKRENNKHMIVKIESKFFLVRWTNIFPMKYDKYKPENKEKKWKNIYMKPFLIHFHGTRENHFDRDKKNNKESNPLNLWIFVEIFCNKIRCKCHKDDRKNESDSECNDIIMGSSGNSQDIIETHRKVCYNNSPDSRHESSFLRIDMVLGMIRTSKFTIKFPYYIQEEDSSSKFYTDDREEKNGKESKNNTKYCCQSYTKKYRLFSL